MSFLRDGQGLSGRPRAKDRTCEPNLRVPPPPWVPDATVDPFLCRPSPKQGKRMGGTLPSQDKRIHLFIQKPLDDHTHTSP